jgi:sulfate permease, SulP family
MEEDGFEFSINMFQYLFLNIHNLALWLPSFILAALLRVITNKFHHQLIFPLCKLEEAIYSL